METLKSYVGFIVVLVVIRVISSVIHEIGHVLSARAVFPGEPISVYFGSYGGRAPGDRQLRVGRVTVHIRMNPLIFLGGLTVIREPHPSEYRKMATVVLGGPFFSLLIAITSGISLRLPLPDVLQLGLVFLVFIGAVDFATNLIPYRVKLRGAAGGYLPSDGQQLLNLYRHHKRVSTGARRGTVVPFRR